MGSLPMRPWQTEVHDRRGDETSGSCKHLPCDAGHGSGEEAGVEPSVLRGGLGRLGQQQELTS